MKTESKPAYPEGAKIKGLEADVWVQAIVGTDGLVHRAKITKPSAHGLEPGFELCALNAAMGNIFDPALKEGKPVAVWVTYPVSFRLK
jgi:protein TonB